MFMKDAMKYRSQYIRRFNIVVFYNPFFSGNALDSCDGRIISNNNMYVDFTKIKYQCSCSFINALNAQLIYYLNRNPGYDGCGTAVQIKEINGAIYRMPCMSSVPFFELSQSTTVELVCSVSTQCSNAEYCLRILSNSMYF